MRGLTVLLILALVVIAIDNGEVPLPVVPWGFNLEDSAIGLGAAYPSRRVPPAHKRLYQPYRLSSPGSSRAWSTWDPLARYRTAHQRLTEAVDRFDQATNSFDAGMQQHDWQQLRGSIADLRAAKRAFGEAIAILQAS